MKLLYILCTLMFLGILLIFFCSAKVLNDLNTSPQIRINRMRGRPIVPSVQPRTQVYVIGTYLGLTFFLVGGAGSILALFQSMRRY